LLTCCKVLWVVFAHDRSTEYNMVRKKKKKKKKKKKRKKKGWGGQVAHIILRPIVGSFYFGL